MDWWIRSAVGRTPFTAGADVIRVQIACPDGPDYRVIDAVLPPGATAGEALSRCGLVMEEGAALGVFGRVVTADAPLADGDRLELYLPLRVDPKTARRRRAAANEKKSAGR